MLERHIKGISEAGYSDNGSKAIFTFVFSDDSKETFSSDLTSIPKIIIGLQSAIKATEQARKGISKVGKIDITHHYQASDVTSGYANQTKQYALKFETKEAIPFVVSLDKFLVEKTIKSLLDQIKKNPQT